jgi:transcriptional regulator with XRE-family HTH domain
MIVRKLRLQRGWSQEQLAHISALNVRTIQPIERGQAPSLESKKSLAAAFEVQLATFDNIGKAAAEVSMYLIFAVTIIVVKGFDDNVVIWGLLGWTVGVIVHGLNAYEMVNLFNANWERKIAEKKLGRKR